MSGVVNNDLLSVVCMIFTLLFTARWYKNQSIRNILKIALTFGLGMLSKLSAWMVAVPVAVVFTTALVRKPALPTKKAL